MQKASDIYLDQFARLGIFCKVQQLANYVDASLVDCQTTPTTPTGECEDLQRPSQSSSCMSLNFVCHYLLNCKNQFCF